MTRIGTSPINGSIWRNPQRWRRSNGTPKTTVHVRPVAPAQHAQRFALPWFHRQRDGRDSFHLWRTAAAADDRETCPGAGSGAAGDGAEDLKAGDVPWHLRAGVRVWRWLAYNQIGFAPPA